jgi:hypothetical protein
VRGEDISCPSQFSGYKSAQTGSQDEVAGGKV